MKTKPKNPNREPQDFYAAAQAFEVQKIDEIKKSRRLAWTVTGGFALLAALATVSQIVMVATRKDPEPWVIQVDNATGASTIKKNVKDAQFQFDEVVNKFWLKQYVQARESYDWYTISADYNTVLLMSEPNIGTEYATLSTAKDSPVETLKDKFKIISKVTSITFIEGVAQVRYTRTKLTPAGDALINEPPTKWIATVAFSFGNSKMTEEQRLINPLDFKAASYRIDPEKAN
jgi:type IV secretion system protein VirB8